MIYRVAVLLCSCSTPWLRCVALAPFNVCCRLRVVVGLSDFSFFVPSFSEMFVVTFSALYLTITLSVPVVLDFWAYQEPNACRGWSSSM